MFSRIYNFWECFLLNRLSLHPYFRRSEEVFVSQNHTILPEVFVLCLSRTSFRETILASPLGGLLGSK